MSFSVFINFDGNCREAVEFYAGVFKSKVVDLMTYDQMPADPDFIMPEADRKRIMYASVMIEGCNVMFSDNPPGMPLVKGNNVIPTLSPKSMDEIKRMFDELAAGGKVDMELQKTFWSDLYGMVTDKYGIIWQFSHDSGKRM